MGANGQGAHMNLLRAALFACAAALAVPAPAEARTRRTTVAVAKKPVAKASSKKAKPSKRKAKKVVKRKAAERAVADLTESGKPNVQSRQAIVIDLDSNEVLWSREPDTVRPIASVSKVMAALVAVEKGLKLDEEQTMTDEDARVAKGGARSRLLAGYRVTNHELLRAALLGSDNRAVSALGRSVGLNAKAFAAAMTAKAKSLGLKKTRFGDPTGLDERNVSTAREVVTMLMASLTNETLKPIYALSGWDLTFSVGSGTKARTGTLHYVNTNRLLRGSVQKNYGGKTGYTDPANYCFATAGEVEKHRIAAVFLNGEGELTRFGDFRRVAVWMKKEVEAGRLKASPVQVAALGVVSPSAQDEDAPTQAVSAPTEPMPTVVEAAPAVVAEAPRLQAEPTPRPAAAVREPASARPPSARGDALPGYIPVAPFPPPSAPVGR